MIVSSFWVTLGAMLVGAPLGVAAAIFLTEFVPRPVMRIVKPAIELLAGIPSVVYGSLASWFWPRSCGSIWAVLAFRCWLLP